MRNMLQLLLLLLLLLLLQHSVPTTEAAIPIHNVTIEENLHINAAIANVWQLLNRPMNPNVQLSFTETIKKTQLFKIDADGYVRVNSTIDRENVKYCSKDNDICRLTVEISGKEGMQQIEVLIMLIVTIKDMNDNAPYFIGSADLSWYEGTMGSDQTLPTAKDDDKGDNGIDNGTYELIGYNNVFRIANGKLQVLRPLDHESQKLYNITLRACDNGTPRLCTDKAVTVKAVDTNDNYPIIQALPVINLLENVTVGSVVVNISASDADSGRNGELTYKVKDTHRFAALNNGSIILNYTLDAAKQSYHKVKVEVADNGESSRKKYIYIEFTVKDLNDHAPYLELERKDNIGENIIYDTIIVTVAKDADTDDDNKRISCEMAGDTASYFSLRLDTSTTYQELYRISNNIGFDYEEKKFINAVIECRDYGKPSLTSTTTYKINIVNQNEFAPQIAGDGKSLFATFSESAKFGDTLMELIVTDGDADDNVTVEFDRTNPLTNYFDIIRTSSDPAFNRFTFNIVLKREIDRDASGSKFIIEMALPIVLTDQMDSNGKYHTVRKNVTLQISDANDNPPIIQPPLEFKLSESCIKDALAVSNDGSTQKLIATDRDAGVNADVTFDLVTIIGVRASKPEQLVNLDNPLQWPVQVNKAGNILCIGGRYLDREYFKTLLLTVKAVNSISPVQLSSTATVTLYITDENDNKPTWLIPLSSGESINISSAHPLHREIIRVQATDSDRASNITYTLVSVSKYFTIDARSGSLTAVRPLLPGQYLLTLRADDNMKYSKQAVTELMINVLSHSGKGGLSQLRDAQINLTIILSMIVLTGVVSVALVAAIVCVRRRGESGSGIGDSLANGSDVECCDKSDWNNCQCHSLHHHGDKAGQFHVSADPFYFAAAAAAQSKQQQQQHRHRQQQQQQMQQMQQMPLSTFHRNEQLHHSLHRNEVLVSLQELDRDSADSGKGGSEDGHNGRHQQSHHQPNQLISPPPHMQPACQYLGIAEEEPVDTTAAATAAAAAAEAAAAAAAGNMNRADRTVNENSPILSFLPPPLPPHGVQY